MMTEDLGFIWRASWNWCCANSNFSWRR